VDTRTELRHLRREVRTALELAAVALAPEDLIDGLAAAAGLLEALEELPADDEPVATLAAHAARRARGSLAAWQHWRERHVARG